MSAPENAATAPQGPPYWTETFGASICAMAGSLGIRPEEVALLIAGIMGNISGPAAGVVGASGRRIPPGFNLLFVGTSDPKIRRVKDHLLGPVIGMQDFQRDLTLRCHQGMTDFHKFGAASIADVDGIGRGSKGHNRALGIFRAAESDLGQSDGISARWDVPPNMDLMDLVEAKDEKLLMDRLPGPRHRPSFIFTTSDASRLDEMLAETMDQHIFLVDPMDGFFRGSFIKSPDHGNRAIANLAQHLGGADVAVPPLHPLQGYGRFQRSRVRFLASLDLPRLSEIVESEEGPHPQVLGQSVLWHPDWRRIRSFGAAHGTEAWRVYKTAVLQALNGRIFRTGPVTELEPGESGELERIEGELMSEMDQQPAHLHRFFEAFSFMVPQLLWAFMLLRQDTEPKWCLKAAQVTAQHAFKGHVALLEVALNQARESRQRRVAERLHAVLEEKGSCTARALQRSLYRSKKSDIEAALDLLIRDQRIRLLAGTREYQVSPAGHASRQAIEQHHPVGPA